VPVLFLYFKKMMKLRRGILCLICCIKLVSISGQEVFLTLRGKVSDAKSGSGISSASIHLRSGGSGTASNSSGAFIFKIPQSAVGDSMVISCIGYKPLLLPVKAALNRQLFTLEPSVLELEAVAVRARGALDLLKEVLEKIPQNYDTTETQYTAFYRENVWMGDVELAFSEAVLDIYRPFRAAPKPNDQLRVLKGRKKQIDYGREAQLYSMMSGVSNGARGSLTDDLVKYRDAKYSPFNPANFRSYEYSFGKSVRSGNNVLVVLNIDPRKKAKKAMVHLKVFIDEATLSIVKYDMRLSENGIRHVSRQDKGIGYMIMSKVVHATIEYHRFEYSVLYSQYRDKWYLNRVTRHWEIYVDSKRRNWEDRLWLADSDLIMTDRKTENEQPITEGDIGGKTSPMHTLFGSEVDETFWENYNILKPETSDSLNRMATVDTISKAMAGQDTTEPPPTANINGEKRIVQPAPATNSALKTGTNSDLKTGTNSDLKTGASSDLKTETIGSLKTGANNDLKTGNAKTINRSIPNRQNGFTRADTLRGMLTPMRTCFDVKFYHLDVAVDLDKRSVTGSNLVRFTAVESFRTMQIDLYQNMKIDSIISGNKSLDYNREFNAVFIIFPDEIHKGSEGSVKIFYHGVPQEPDFSIPMNGGILWDKDSLGNTWAQVVCQGSGASLWWPNKDHQSDEPDSMKMWITVPNGYEEISNGQLVVKRPIAGGHIRYEWFVSYPINNYNVTFGIGKYAHFRDLYVSDDTLAIDYYVMPYNLDRAKRMFRQVPLMLKTFEKNFGKYPFPRDGFKLVESLYPMEHQSGVCIGKITGENSVETNPLMWHEVAHEWWGNAITTRDIADMWVHEAFATYAETIMIEEMFGRDAGTQSMIAQQNAVSDKEPVTGVYDVNHIHYDIGNMYSKGSLLLHTFRNVLDNDKLWVNLLREIQKEFRYQTLTAAELVTFINKFTKSDYTYLFDQYLHYTTLPALQIMLKPLGKDLQIRFRWAADVKNFRMPVKVMHAANEFKFIYPGPDWKTVILKNMSAEEFEVDEEQFYIDVKID
jgi:hypothetical protein